MITNFILNVVYIFVLGITQLLSSFGEVPLNNSLTTSIITLKTFYMSLNAFIPLETIAAIIAFDLAFEGIYVLYKLIRWGYQKVPMVN